MRKAIDKETIGLAMEIVGLTVLVMAAIWQASVTDWFDTFPAKSQLVIQETANLALLRAHDRTALALAEEDSKQKKVYLSEINELTRTAMSELIDTRTRFNNVDKTQGTPIKWVRHSLFILGAILIIIGKILVLLGKLKNRS
jgi:hypothetical protein